MKEVTRSMLESSIQIDCANTEEVEALSFEALAQSAQTLADKVTEIQLERNQFDLPAIYAEAQKMGLDVGDLDQYGLDFRTMRPTVDTYEEFSLRMNMLLENLWIAAMVKLGRHVSAAECSGPIVRSPRVQFVWNMWPWPQVLGCWVHAFNCLTLPCCYIGCCEYMCCLPCNTCADFAYCLNPINPCFFCALSMIAPLVGIAQGSEAELRKQAAESGK